MKKKAIIGIHGLGNKPPRNLSEKWWKWAILEGVQKIGHPALSRLPFELVYWAHFLHSEPLNSRIKDPSHPLYLDNPYVPSEAKPAHFRPSRFKKTRLALIEKILDMLFLRDYKFFNFDGIFDYIIRKKFEDLALYYDQTNVDKKDFGLYAKTRIREELAKSLRKHRKKAILLIAHSMGSIIAYDVLTQVVPKIKIHTFITLGSPLGLPAVMKKILAEQQHDFRKLKKVPAPENITSAWLNFSDLDDRVAMNYNLADDFGKNAAGVGPVDVVVKSDYAYNGKKNPHKSYGYLRAPEVAEAIYAFLSEKKPTALEAFKEKVRNFFT
ncbi:MAG: hypothetical protein ACE5IR_04665 [bacterium]